MTYTAFRKEVFDKKLAMPQLRCDELPTEDLMDLIDRCGVDLYESFVRRLQMEADANLQKMAFAAEYR